MNRDKVFNYIFKKYHVRPSYLWDKYPLYGVFKNDKGKWFGLIMNISKDKLGLDSSEEVFILNVKYYPDLIGSLRLSKGIFKAYHMNKEHWVSVILDDTVSEEKIKELIDVSYELNMGG